MILSKALQRLADGLAIEKPEEKPRETPAVNVKTRIVTAVPTMPDTLELPGRVEANRVVRVAAEVPGRIERIYCEEGRACAAGDRLLQINLDLLRAEFDRASAQYEFDKLEYERIQSLVKGGAATAKERDRAESARDVSRAAAEAAGIRLARAEVYAPVSGVLNELLVEEGEYVQAGMPVAEIVEIDTVKVVVNVPERDLHFFKTGGEVTVLVTGSEEKRLAGTITYISQLADEGTYSTSLEVMLDNRKRLLKSGQLVNVRLTRRILKDVVMVPLLAVIPLENSKEVFVVETREDNGAPVTVAQPRKVKLGFFKGDEVRIVEGLKPGEQLIVAGHQYVGAGQRVQVVEEGSGAE